MEENELNIKSCKTSKTIKSEEYIKQLKDNQVIEAGVDILNKYKKVFEILAK